MTATTVKVPGDVRDALARVARDDFGGVTLGRALRALIEEHTKRRILEAYERLRARPEEWASYTGELEEWAELGAETVRRSGE